MPLRLPDKLPAIELLKEENIFVIDDTRAHHQDIRPLKIVVLNLMPLKIITETDLVRILSNTPLQLDITFMRLNTHVPKHTPMEHMMMFYRDFEELRERKFDGMIITGAPVEMLNYEDVTYWEELVTIFRWAQTHVTSTIYICWAAQAALYLRYGIPKYTLARKKFGVFKHTLLRPSEPIFRGFDDYFMMPHSRHTELRKEDILLHKELVPLAESEEAGISVLMERGGREFYLTGHFEYPAGTLNTEYRRDFGKRDDVGVPENYYIGNNPDNKPLDTWRSAGHLFYHNWINYYVYQATPYDINEIF